MAFNDEVLKDARGKVIRIDASTDKFSTVSYRWGTSAGELDGTNMYSNRILSLGPIKRGLGQNRIAGGGTCELVLANADGGLDALAGQSSMSTQAKLRLRIYVCLYAPGADPLSFTSKLLGEFSLTGWVRRNNETLTLPLGDDVMGAVAQQAALPNFIDWQGVGTTATNPIKNGCGLPDSETEYTPIQLAFGEDWVLAHPHALPFGTLDAAYEGKIIVPVCCTTSTAAASQDEITNVRVSWFNGNTQSARIVEVPRSVVSIANDDTPTTTTVWTVERSPTITKDGKSFRIIYLVVRSDLGALNILNNPYTGGSQLDDDSGGYNPTYDSPQFSSEFAGGYPPTAIYQQRSYASNDPERPQYASFGAAVLAWYVKGVPLSARTQTTSAIQHPVDVLTDLAGYYSNNTSITVNTTEGDRVKAATASAACAGVVQPWLSGPKRGDPVFQQPPSLRQIITSICQSADIDCFIDWSGQFSFSTDFWDITISSSGSASWTPDGAYQTSGNGVTTTYIPTVIPETWISGLVETIPSDGERWAPYNRLWLNGGKANPAEGREVPFQGPWDFGESDGAAIDINDRIIEATLEQGWRPFRQQALEPKHWRLLNITARPVVTFRAHIGGLQLELGQYFALSWTRGPTLAGPYSGTIFQCESITYAQADDTVEISGVWRQDVMTERQYLLDDETLIVRSKGGGSSTVAVNSAGTNAIFTGTVDLVAMGVEAGDILILRDSSQADDVFTLNLANRITSVDATDELSVADAWGATAAAIANADWSIQRGATTYHTAVSDPTNYPLGGDRYGKVTDTDGLYSNAETGNRLISG